MDIGKCDWCKKDNVRLFSGRDFNEGLHGPTYLVCDPCLEKQRNELDDEFDDADGDYMNNEE